MDNLTHSLVGLLCAEAVVRTREGAEQRPLANGTRTAVYALAIIGNNLPDLDVVYASISGKIFGYLLQHRGYTHTLAAALGFALIMLSVCLWRMRARQTPVSPADWRLLAAVALVSPVLHLILDFANNYGVHPFWPLDNGWFYGDSLFIVEPSLWLVVIAPLSFSYRATWLRVVLWVLLGVTLGALWSRSFVPRGHALALTVLTAALLAVSRTQTPKARSRLALAGFALLALTFVAGSRAAKALVRERARRQFPQAITLDVVVTPMPANPFCWSALLVQRDGGDYAVRLAGAATWPARLSVDECPFDRGVTPTAPLRALASAPEPALAFTNEYRAPLADLQALAGVRCEAQAFFRFARVPYLSAAEPDGSRVLGDLRYDRKRGLDFSDIRLTARPAQSQCPNYVPAWRPPRADILSVGDEASGLSILGPHD